MFVREMILNFSDIYKCVIFKYELVVFYVYFWFFIDICDVFLLLMRNFFIKELVVMIISMLVVIGFRGIINNEICFLL